MKRADVRKGPMLVSAVAIAVVAAGSDAMVKIVCAAMNVIIVGSMLCATIPLPITAIPVPKAEIGVIPAEKPETIVAPAIRGFTVIKTANK